jgi:hypothetical protein
LVGNIGAGFARALRARHEHERRVRLDNHLERRDANELAVGLNGVARVGLEADVAAAAVEDAIVGSEILS